MDTKFEQVIKDGFKQLLTEPDFAEAFKQGDVTKMWKAAWFSYKAPFLRNYIVANDLTDKFLDDVGYIPQWFFYGLPDFLPKVETFVVSQHIRHIDSEAFAGCKSLKTLIFVEPSKVTNIEEGAFEGCLNLNSVVIPESVDFIAPGAFQDCTGLESIIIPVQFNTSLDKIFYGVDLDKVEITYI